MTHRHDVVKPTQETGRCLWGLPEALLADAGRDRLQVDDDVRKPGREEYSHDR